MFDDFYQLTARPFQLTPDPNFYFESGTHRKALSYLGYGMAQSEGFIVITGEIGAGKSTLVAHMMQRIDPEQLTVGQVVTSNLDGEELVHVAAQSFGLDVEGHDKAAALGMIESFLHDEAREGRRCMLVVDESQNLSIEALEELRMLSNFQLGAHPLLQLLLLGQPEFKQILATHNSLEQLRQRVIAAHHLEAMELNELEPYIKHRLECVGWRGNPEFDQAIFAEMHAATKGIPRRVNQVATRLLLLGAVEQRTRIDGAMLNTVLNEMNSDSTLPETAQKAPVAQEAPVAPVASVAPVAQEAPVAQVVQEAPIQASAQSSAQLPSQAPTQAAPVAMNPMVSQPQMQEHLSSEQPAQEPMAQETMAQETMANQPIAHQPVKVGEEEVDLSQVSAASEMRAQAERAAQQTGERRRNDRSRQNVAPAIPAQPAQMAPTAPTAPKAPKAPMAPMAPEVDQAVAPAMAPQMPDLMASQLADPALSTKAEMSKPVEKNSSNENSDVRIDQLQMAVLELTRSLEAHQAMASSQSAASAASAAETPVGMSAEMAEEMMRKMSVLEAKLEEQEHSVRHVLTMLIEWIENGQKPRVAA